MLTHIPPKFWNFKPCRKCLWSSLDASEAFMCSKTWYALVNWEFCWTGCFLYKKNMPLRRKNLLMLEKATFNQTWPSICSFPVRARKGFLFVLVWIFFFVIPLLCLRLKPMTMKFTIIEGGFTIIFFFLLLEAFIISFHWFLFVKGSFLFSSLRVIKLVPHARWLPCSQITLKTLKNPLWPKKEIRR